MLQEVADLSRITSLPSVAYCHGAKLQPDKKGIDYVEYDVTHDVELEQVMRSQTGRTSVPQIYITGAHLGGFDNLSVADRDGRLPAPMMLFTGSIY